MILNPYGKGAADGSFEQYGQVASQLADITNNIGNRRDNTIVLLGDSITARNVSTGMYSSRGFFVAANFLMRQRFDIVRCAGVGGETIEQIAARLETDVYTYNPTYCFVLAGRNNTGTATDIFNNLKTLLWIPLLAKGITVIAGTITPAAADTGLMRGTIQRVNDAIRKTARATSNMLCVDFARAVTDGKTGLWRTGYSDDGIHQNAVGAMAMAREVQSVLGTVPTLSSNDFYGDVYDPLSIVANPMAFGANANGVNGFVTGTNVTGTGPATWNVIGTANTPVVCTGSQSRGDYIDGEALQVVCTFGADNDYVRIIPAPLDIYLDRAWASGASKQFGELTKPTAGRAAGFQYKCINYAGGTTGTTQPTWPAALGETVTDGTVTWLCIDDAVEGAQYILEADIMFTTISGFVYPSLNLNLADSGYATLSGKVLNGSEVIPVTGAISSPYMFECIDYFPLDAVITLKTPPIVLGAGALSHITPAVRIWGKNGSTCTVKILRIDMRRVSNL